MKKIMCVMIVILMQGPLLAGDERSLLPIVDPVKRAADGRANQLLSACLLVSSAALGAVSLIALQMTSAQWFGNNT